MAVKMRSDGLSAKQTKSTLDKIFTHGCHCGWNYGRFELTDKGQKPKDALDKICLEFEHCSECAKIDGCDLDADFEPHLNGTRFTCDHLDSGSCQHNKCLCATNMVDRLFGKLPEFEFTKFSFPVFMAECVTEIDPSINTQMVDVFDSQRGLRIEKTRQCCGEYPKRKPFTYTTTTGLACCADQNIFDQKYYHCCPNGDVLRLGDVCW